MSNISDRREIKLKNIKKSLSEICADDIIEIIKFNKMKPGDKLPKEDELCTSLNISRSTLREALKIMTSRNISFIAIAIFFVTALFAATIPPKIESGSDSYALLQASSISFPEATPQGFVCFTATTVGS